MNDRERIETLMRELGRNTVRWILAHLQGVFSLLMANKGLV